MLARWELIASYNDFKWYKDWTDLLRGYVPSAPGHMGCGHPSTSASAI
jgi:hypothetical protein